MLLGRMPERRQIESALERARAGASSTLVLIGEPGIGKTALLDHAAERGAGMQILRARGVESEAQIPFASLLELLRPALAMLDRIPRPQAVALEGALAMRPAARRERFAVGAATLSLLAAFAEVDPVVVLVDDAQWLDGSSAQAMLFAFRRLLADRIAVLIAVREGEPSLLDGTDLPSVRIDGLDRQVAALLTPGLTSAAAGRLHRATAGNPLALLELAADAGCLDLAPEGAPILLPARLSGAFLRRAEFLAEPARRALTLAAASDSGELALLDRAAAPLGIDIVALAQGEAAGLVTLQPGEVRFRHPLVRSAVYAGATVDERRQAHRALAAALPDRDVDQRAWHLATAAAGIDEAASSALEQAGARSRGRSAYATATAAFERAARLTTDTQRRGDLIWQAAETSWLAGAAQHAVALLAEARETADGAVRALEIDQLAGHIATRRGPVMDGHAILTAAAARADPERAAEMLCDAAGACFYGGNPAEMLSVAERAQDLLSAGSSARARFLTATAVGMARIFGGDPAAGADAIREAITLAEHTPELRADPALLPWLPVGPIFLREAGVGRSLIDYAQASARAQAAVGALPFVLNLIARDDATTDRWSVAEVGYREAISLARESAQDTELAFGLAGLAWLLARRGQADGCRAAAAEALTLSARLGARLLEVWAIAALGELELGLGNAEAAAARLEQQQRLVVELGITDVDLSPAAELVDVYTRLERHEDAKLAAHTLWSAATMKGQPWALARALRCRGLLTPAPDFASHFEQALRHHSETPDAFEKGRTQLAYGARLRRSRKRVLARAQLQAAIDTFERLDAAPWADQARAELAATGATVRRRDPSTIDDLTPQELRISLLLSSGRTTRETAAALFLSPKTVEYHLRHVYQKLEINSREQLTDALRSLR